MFRLEKKFRFEASHVLPYHDGKCARMHGHSWVGTLVLEADGLQQSGPQTGMVWDFGLVSLAIKNLLEWSLDHWHLNDTTGLTNPTSEELARWIFNKVKADLPLLTEVRVEETCTSSANYRPNP